MGDRLGIPGVVGFLLSGSMSRVFFTFPLLIFFFHLPLPHSPLFELIFLLFSCIQAFHFSFQAINSPCLAFNLTLTATRLVKQITIERSALSLLLSKKQRVED